MHSSCNCKRSWRQWCVLCQKEFLAGYYIDRSGEIRQWLYCSDCGPESPDLVGYEELAIRQVTEALLDETM